MSVLPLPATAARNEPLIVDHTCTDLNAIPATAVVEAKNLLRVCYGHTSHGSQPIFGMRVLMDDPSHEGLYDFTDDGTVVDGALSIKDWTPAGDLGNADWPERTRDYLDGEGTDRNVVIWSWCGQVSNASVQTINDYLANMSELEAEYPELTFIYMTGHLDGTESTGNLHLRNEQIRDYCLANNKVLFDFADIERYDPDGTDFLDLGVNDTCNYDGGNWAEEWCGAHPGSELCEDCNCAHSHPLNCNLKGRAFWWMFTHIAGLGASDFAIGHQPDHLSFSCTIDGTPPADQQFEIWRVGTGTLAWTVSDDVSWLSLAPLSGSSDGEHDLVTVSVNPSGLSAGQYSGTITIEAPGADNTPQTIPVDLTVSDSIAYSIGFAPASFSFTSVVGHDPPAGQQLEIWRVGTGTMSWTVSDNASWLNLIPASGSSTGEHDVVQVVVDPADIGVGERQATITVTAPGAVNTPQTIPVSLQVSDATTFIAAGPGPAVSNPPRVRIFPTENGVSHLYEFDAYGASRHGVNVSSGNVEGDFQDEILTGAGPGDIYGPHVRGFRINGTPLPGLTFLAYGTHKFGVNVDAGDIDRDGYDEIITGAGPGAVFGPHIRAWEYDGTGSVNALTGVSFFAYGTPKWGVNISAGDIDGDGYDEIVSGAGPGAVYGPHVRAWNVDGGAAAAIPGCSFFAYGTVKYGVKVTCGDVDGDGIDEIITAPGPSPVFAAHVRGFEMDGTPLPGLSFLAWPPNEARFGANVYAGTDLNSDLHDEIVVGCGDDPDAGTTIKVFVYNGSSVSHWLTLDAFPSSWTHGARVTSGRF